MRSGATRKFVDELYVLRGSAVRNTIFGVRDFLVNLYGLRGVALGIICSFISCCFSTSKFSDFLNAHASKCQLARSAISRL